MDRPKQIANIAAVFFQQQAAANRQQMNSIINTHSPKLLDDFSQAVCQLVTLSLIHI